MNEDLGPTQCTLVVEVTANMFGISVLLKEGANELNKKAAMKRGADLIAEIVPPNQPLTRTLAKQLMIRFAKEVLHVLEGK